jgi:hypothetical protein
VRAYGSILQCSFFIAVLGLVVKLLGDRSICDKSIVENISDAVITVTKTGSRHHDVMCAPPDGFVCTSFDASNLSGIVDLLSCTHIAVRTVYRHVKLSTSSFRKISDGGIAGF